MHFMCRSVAWVHADCHYAFMRRSTALGSSGCLLCTLCGHTWKLMERLSWHTGLCRGCAKGSLAQRRWEFSASASPSETSCAANCWSGLFVSDSKEVTAWPCFGNDEGGLAHILCHHSPVRTLAGCSQLRLGLQGCVPACSEKLQGCRPTSQLQHQYPIFKLCGSTVL